MDYCNFDNVLQECHNFILHVRICKDVEKSLEERNKFRFSIEFSGKAWGKEEPNRRRFFLEEQENNETHDIAVFGAKWPHRLIPNSTTI